MAKLLTLRPPITAVPSVPSTRSDSAVSSCCLKTLNPQWSDLQQKLKCNGRFSCLFSNNRRQVSMFSLFFFISDFLFILLVSVRLCSFWALVFCCFRVENFGVVLVC